WGGEPRPVGVGGVGVDVVGGPFLDPADGLALRADVIDDGFAGGTFHGLVQGDPVAADHARPRGVEVARPFLVPLRVDVGPGLDHGFGGVVDVLHQEGNADAALVTLGAERVGQAL